MEWNFNGNPPEQELPKVYLVAARLVETGKLIVTRLWYQGDGKWSVVGSKPYAWAEWPEAPPEPTPQEITMRWITRHFVGFDCLNVARWAVEENGLLEQLGVI